MRFLRLLVVAATLGASSFMTVHGHAQSVDAMPKPVWEGRPSDGGSILNEINKPDCLDADALVTFEVGITGSTSGLKFEVWAGSGCTELTTRDEENSCMRLVEDDPNDTEVTVKVNVKDLVQPLETGAGAGTGTEADCTATTDGTRTLYFMLVDSARKLVGTAGEWTYKFDMDGPSPVTNLKAGPGEESLTLHFEPSDDDDLARYHYYCSAIDEEEAPADGADAAGGAPATIDPDCNSSILVPGKAPPTDDKYECGSDSTTGVDSGVTDSSLRNGVRYAVGVTVEDSNGNESVLSNIECAVPEEVTGFYEAYRAAGGQAGGGFCTFAPARRAAVPTALALLVAAAALWRRRR